MLNRTIRARSYYLSCRLRDLVVFPHMVSPIFVVQGGTLHAIQSAHSNVQTMIGLVQNDPDVELPTAKDFLSIGVELAVGRLLTMPDGNSSALVQGRRRIKVLEYIQEEPFIIVRAKIIEESVEVDKKMDALMRTTRDLFERCVQLDRTLPDEAHLFAININEPGWLADMIATTLSIDLKARRDLLLNTNPQDRLKRSTGFWLRNWMYCCWKMRSRIKFKVKWTAASGNFIFVSR